MQLRITGILFGFWLFLTSCGIDEATSPIFLSSLEYDFREGKHEWVCGFADYPATKADSLYYELKSGHTDLPGGGKAILLSGVNHNDDLFMYLKKRITGLSPNRLYTITFDVELASKAPSAYNDVGGAPGDGVYLKVGATPAEPKAVIKDGMYRLNIDKGNGGTAGADMVVIGNIGVPGNTGEYTIIRRTNLQSASDPPYQARSDANGNLWLIVGTDSDYQGATTVYYTRIVVVLSSPE